MAKTKTTRQRRPKTAYKLCERVCEAIAAHPLNYYQGDWVVHRDKEYYRLPEELDTPQNECGTAFCRAGWMVHIADGAKVAADVNFDHQVRATKLLGGDWRHGESVFDFQVQSLFGGCAVDGTPGTKRYVKNGVSGLRAFMASWSDRLKATKLPPKVSV